MKTVPFKSFNVFADNINVIVRSNDQSIINTINAHSYIVSKKDRLFKEALEHSDILLPDGQAIVEHLKYEKKFKIRKISGAEIHDYLLAYANNENLKCFYLGSSESTLKKIRNKVSIDYSDIIIDTFSPPFKESFTEDDDSEMIDAINKFNPDVLFVGMTAPKQEKWVYKNKERLNVNIIVSIGAVFDFYTGNIKRAPEWMIRNKLEWFHRATSSKRLAKRYAYSSPLFAIEMMWDTFVHRILRKK